MKDNEELLRRTLAFLCPDPVPSDPDGIIECYRSGCRNAYEMAEYFECTEDFLKEALENMHEMYGTYVRCGSYILIFDPYLAVVDRCAVKRNAM